MTLEDLARLVRETRKAQAAFFRGKTPGALEMSKEFERKLDKAVAEILDGPRFDFGGGE